MTTETPLTSDAPLTTDAPLTLDLGAVRFGADGLIAAVVQDATDGRVLMVAWQDREALEATLRTRDVHFHSRSRGTLWRKGETSGNVLRLRAAALDCDSDAILLSVDAAGPACHTGARSCFDVGESTVAEAQGTDRTAGDEPVDFAWLGTLWSTIQQRAADRPAGSYTTRLLDGGVDATARKVAEEAVEVLMAAKDDAAAVAAATDDPAADPTRDRSALSGEFADLLFHTLVLMAERGLSPSSVIDTLKSRAGPPPR